MRNENRVLILRVDAGDSASERARSRARAIAERTGAVEQALVVEPLLSSVRIENAEARPTASRPRRWLSQAALVARREWLRAALVDGTRRAQPQLLVLPPARWVTPSLALDVAATTHVPTLIARGVETARRIVAATDLRDPQLPLVTGAASWSQRLDARLVLVHARHSPREREAVAGRLEDVAKTLGTPAEVAVTAEDDPARSLLDVARTWNADLVMVGARERPWWDLRPRPRVAELVLASSGPSILLLPLSARDPLADLGS